jgi:hypothetical protein
MSAAPTRPALSSLAPSYSSDWDYEERFCNTIAEARHETGPHPFFDLHPDWDLEKPNLHYDDPAGVFNTILGSLTAHETQLALKFVFWR